MMLWRFLVELYQQNIFPERVAVERAFQNLTLTLNAESNFEKRANRMATGAQSEGDMFC